MDDTIDHLYTTFSYYRLGGDFPGPELDDDRLLRLTEIPLRELSFIDVDYYANGAIQRWGNDRHFKHFLPRLFELTVDHRDDFFDLPFLFGKLQECHFDQWSYNEKDAVYRFLDKYWENQLAEPVLEPFLNSVDLVLCAYSRAIHSIQRFLDFWLTVSTCTAKRHLAALILGNSALLIKKGRMSNYFWITESSAHREIVNWLQTEELLCYLAEGQDSTLLGDFGHAWPQLLALRSSLKRGFC